MYILDIKNKIYYNTKLNKVFDLNELKFIKNDHLLEHYKDIASNNIMLTEKMQKIELTNKIYNGVGFILDESGKLHEGVFSSIGKLAKDMIPTTTEDWIHLGVDGFSAILDMTGIGTGLSFIIDIFHGLYYIASAFGYIKDHREDMLEYLLMGVVTLAFATVPGGGNLGNIVFKKLLSKSAKKGAPELIKTTLKTPGSRSILKKGLNLILNKTGKFNSNLNKLISKLEKSTVGKWLVKAMGLRKLERFFVKHTDNIVEQMTHNKYIVQLAEEVGVPIGKATKGKIGKTVSTKTAKEFLKQESELAFKEFGKYSLKAADKKIVQKMIKETQERVLKETAELSGKEATIVTKKISTEITEKYSSLLVGKVPKDELSKIVGKLTTKTKIVSNSLKTSMRMTAVRKAAGLGGKETAEQTAEQIAKATTKTTLKTSTRILRSIKRFGKKQFAAGMLIYSDNAKKLLNLLFNAAGENGFMDDEEIRKIFLESLKDVIDLVPDTTKKDVKNNEFTEEGVKTLQKNSSNIFKQIS